MRVLLRPGRLSNGWTTGLLTLGLLTGAFGIGNQAQSSTGLLLRSGLHTFGARHTARVTVVELGDPGVASRVILELRDSRDRVVGRTAGVLRRGEPVQLDLPLPNQLVQLRASVAIVSAIGSATRPSTTVEDIDMNSLSAIPKVICGPPSGRDTGQPFCTDWEATSFVP